MFLLIFIQFTLTTHRVNMVNIFGEEAVRRRRGPPGVDGLPGPQGDPGENGIDLMSVWMSNTLTKSLRENDENGCFFIRNLKDIERDGKKIKRWITKSSNGKNLNAVRPSESLVKLPDDQGYAIEFTNSLYVVDIPLYMGFMSGYGFFCVTFKTQEVKEQTLFSNHDKQNPDYPGNELLVSKSKISICGVENEKPASFSIDHDCRDWTTLFVEWNVNTVQNKSTFHYIINNDKKLTGSFSFDTFWITTDFIAIGDRDDDSLYKPFNGQVRAIEFYFSTDILDGKCLPTSLRNKIIESQCVRSNVPPTRNHKIDAEVEGPSRKIMKIDNISTRLSNSTM